MATSNSSTRGRVTSRYAFRLNCQGGGDQVGSARGTPTRACTRLAHGGRWPIRPSNDRCRLPYATTGWHRTETVTVEPELTLVRPHQPRRGPMCRSDTRVLPCPAMVQRDGSAAGTSITRGTCPVAARKRSRSGWATTIVASLRSGCASTAAASHSVRSMTNSTV
jgi:hypothetical protein